MSSNPPRPVAWAFMGALALAYIVVAVHTPIGIFPWAPHDDGLHMKLGASLARGEWLGPFDQFTLMKGPGYPLFLAVAHWLGVPVSLAHAVFHCTAVILFVVLLHRFVRVPALSALMFVLLLWHPIALTEFLLRVLRDAIYYGQVLLCLALFTCALFCSPETGRRWRYGLLTGLVLGWLWLTREEGLVLLPAIAVLVAAAGRLAVHERRLRSLAATLAVVIVVFGISQVGFRAMNAWWYGTFVGVDFNEGNFQRALKALHSVRSGEVRPFVSVTRATRQRIYAVSPTFASLRHALDGPLEKGWSTLSCRAVPITCGEIGAGWFMWALRDAAAMAGHYASPARASAFFGRMADEISSGCARGALECRPQLISAMPAVETGAMLARLPDRLWRALGLLLFLRPPVRDYPTIEDPQYRLAASLRFLNYPLHMLADASARFSIHGWYRAAGRDWFSAELNNPQGMPVPLRLHRVASPDLVDHFKDPSAIAQRFVLGAECSDNCVLRLTAPGGGSIQKTLGEMRRPLTVSLGQGTFRVDQTDVGASPMYERQRVDEWSRRVRAWVLGSYAFLFIPVLIAGAAAFLWSSIAYRRTVVDNVAYVLALASWLVVAARVLFLALVDATSMPALNEAGYVAPAHYLVVAAAVFSIAGWWQLRARPAQVRS